MDPSPSKLPGDAPAVVATAPASPQGFPDALAVPQVDDQEKPGRELHGWTNRLVAVVAFAVAVLTIGQVFRPLSQGSQF